MSNAELLIDNKLAKPIISNSLIEQTKSFLAPRKHLEMGGLLFGHVDEEGNNVCIAGFFPEQIQATPSYCEFSGSYMVTAAMATSIANEQILQDSPNSPTIRVLGWIHTHPDIPIYLSGIDIRTYKKLLNLSPDGRFIAVVVDPINDKHGVFQDPNNPHTFSSSVNYTKLSNSLKKGYLVLLEELEKWREQNGETKLPFILTGDLNDAHILKGYKDDSKKATNESIYQLKDNYFNLTNELLSITEKVNQNMKHLSYSNKSYQENSLLIQENNFRLSDLENKINSLNKSVKYNEKMHINLGDIINEIRNPSSSYKKTWKQKEYEEWSELQFKLASPEIWNNSEIYNEHFSLISQNPKMAKLAFKNLRGKRKLHNNSMLFLVKKSINNFKKILIGNIKSFFS